MNSERLKLKQTKQGLRLYFFLSLTVYCAGPGSRTDDASKTNTVAIESSSVNRNLLFHQTQRSTLPPNLLISVK